MSAATQLRYHHRAALRFVEASHFAAASCPPARARDLRREFVAAEVAMSWTQCRWLFELQGISGGAWYAAGGWGTARVWPGHNGTYLPGCLGDGRDFNAIILGVWSGAHSKLDDFYETWPSLIDLLAFDPKDPSRWYLRNGGERYGVMWLGEWALDTAQGLMLSDADKPGPLRLFRTPLSWLKGGCRGACLLSPALEDKTLILREALRGTAQVICDDMAHAEAVDKALKRTWPLPKKPKVMIAEDEDWNALPETPGVPLSCAEAINDECVGGDVGRTVYA